MVLLTLAVQSIHIYYHQHHEVEHVCDGSHEHHNHDECEVCDFVFSYFVAQPVFYYPFPEKNNPLVAVSCPIEIAKIAVNYTQPRRGPPFLL